VPKQELKTAVAAIRVIFNSASLDEAKRLLRETVEHYRRGASKLATWMEENLPEGVIVFAFPPTHWRWIRTTSGRERLNQEIRRRTRGSCLFPNEASCLRLVTAVVLEISEEWERQ
jgi:transposase-like protein